MWWLWMLGCHWTPHESGPNGLVGRLLDPMGMPLAGVPVESLEARERTDEEGRFAVQYKPPDELVHFVWNGTWYKRVYRDEDAGKVVDVKLPPVRDAKLSCALDQPCDLELGWDLGEGLTARVTTACTPGAEPVLLPSIPKGTPSLQCRGAEGNRAAVLEDRGETMEILPPPVPVRVEIRAEEGREPSDCAVQIGRRAGVASGEGFWTAEATGTVTVSAVCEGRHAVPKTVRAGAGEVALDWSPTGPDVDLAGMPLASDLYLVREGAGDDPGWMIRVPAGADGRFALPPLASGSYRVAVGDPGRLAVVSAPAEPAPAGVLQVLAVTPGDGTSPGGLVGLLRLEEDLVEGQIPVTGLQ
jgi:hypothetical protein